MAQSILEFKHKSLNYIIININNITKCAKEIADSLTNGIQINSNINLKNRNEIKQHVESIQMLAFELIKHYDTFNEFLPCTLNFVDIQNINIFLKFMWLNPLIMRNCMKDDSKWKVHLVLLRILLTHKFRTKKECIDLILTISSSMVYWKKKHIKFLIECGYANALCSFFRKIYLEQHESLNVLILLLNMTKLVWLFCMPQEPGFSKLYNYAMQWTKHLHFVLFRYIDECPLCEITKKNSKIQKKCKKLHQMIRKLRQELNIIAFSCLSQSQKTENDNISIIHQENQHFSFSKVLQMSRENRIISLKICGNKKCKKIQDLNLKICKKCKLIYYCSRYCQKIDWKYKHRKFCDELSNKMELN